MFIRSSTTNWH